MKLLLDTHTFLWFIAGSPRLPRAARELIEEPANQRLLSVASLWEMAIKISLGKLESTQSFVDLVRDQVEGNAIDVMPIAPSHLDVLTQLPFLHRDPFDRLIVAQSLAEGLPVLSGDPELDGYSITRLWNERP